MWWLSGWPLTPSRPFSPSPPETMTWTQTGVLTPPHDPPAQDDCKAHGPCPVANTDTKLLIHGLFQKGRVLAQDGIEIWSNLLDLFRQERHHAEDRRRGEARPQHEQKHSRGAKEDEEGPLVAVARRLHRQRMFQPRP